MKEHNVFIREAGQWIKVGRMCPTESKNGFHISITEGQKMVDAIGNSIVKQLHFIAFERAKK